MDAPDRAGASTRAALDRCFEVYYRLHPVNATFTGVHDHDTHLPDWSPEGLDAMADELAALRSHLPTSPPPVEGPDAWALAADLELVRGVLEIQRHEVTGTHFHRRNPALHTGEAVFAVLSLVLRDFAPAPERARRVEERLRRIPDFLAGARRTLGEHAAPASWTERALRETTGALRLFGNGLDAWCAEHRLDEGLAAAVRRAAARAATAVEDFASWLRGRTTASSDEVGCGEAMFDLLLTRAHHEGRRRDDLLHEARAAFAETEAALDAAAHACDPGGWPAVQRRLADDHPSIDGYLDCYEDTRRECEAEARRRDLVTWPDAPLRFVPIPEWARDAAPNLYFLHYRSPAPYDPAGTVDYLVPPIDDRTDPAVRRAVNRSVITSNHVVHHGSLGHHVQNHYAARSASRVGRIAAVDCASRIAMLCGGTLAEGWACYATDLMEEIGFLEPLERVAQQHSRLRQLARAIVDIELHQGTMDEAAAAAYYATRVGMAPAAARGEVVKNAMFPGAAVMYWLGTDGLHALRARRERDEGAAFTLRRFHDTLLQFGAIPVPMIRRLMTATPPPNR